MYQPHNACVWEGILCCFKSQWTLNYRLVDKPFKMHLLQKPVEPLRRWRDWAIKSSLLFSIYYKNNHKRYIKFRAFFSFFSGSVHVLYKNVNDFHRTANKVKSFFRKEGIACMTFQPEFLPVDSAVTEDDSMVSFTPNSCYFRCSDKDCETLTCCAVAENDTGENTSLSIDDNTEESSVTPEIDSLTSLTS